MVEPAVEVIDMVQVRCRGNVQGSTCNVSRSGLLRRKFGLISDKPIRSLTCINWLSVIATASERARDRQRKAEIDDSDNLCTMTGL